MPQPFAYRVAQRPGIGAAGHGDSGGHTAAGAGDLGLGGSAGAHRDLGVAVAGVDGMAVRVDQPGGDQAAAEVVDLVDVDDVVDDPGQALREVGGSADPGDAVVVHEHGRVTEQVGAGPQSPDVGQQSYCHRLTGPLQ